MLESSKLSETGETSKSSSKLVKRSVPENLDEFVEDLGELVSSYERGDKNKPKQQQQYHKKQKQSQDLDPMDPASYSDIARGKWSAGLDKGDL